MFEVYAIYNRKNDKIYIGQTRDLGPRLKAHNDGRFTNSHTARFDGGWELIYSEPSRTHAQALRREKQLKSYRGREFIKQHIPG